MKPPSVPEKNTPSKMPVGSKGQMDRYRAELQEKCTAAGLDLADPLLSKETAKEISQIILTWMRNH